MVCGVKQVLHWLALTIALGGCAFVEQKAPVHAYSADIAQLLSGQALLGQQVSVTELPSVALFAITPEMANFAEHAVKRGGDSYEKVKLLHEALLLPTASGGRGITYNAYVTQTPINTFSTRQANCLSFSLLYVALARHVGLNADINEVEIPPTWDLRNRNAMLFMRHVNVKIALRRGEGVRAFNTDDAVIDLEMGRYKASYPQHAISDSLTAAQFYNNRSMELANEGNMKDAFLNVRKALQEDSQQSYIWNNFASLFSRKNLLSEAEKIYVYGLSINPNDLSIINNLATLYIKNGDNNKAAIYRDLAQRHHQTNPYYQYMLALSAFDDSDNVNALLYVNRAIEREKKEIRFYQLAASIYEKMGDAPNTEKMLKKILPLQQK